MTTSGEWIGASASVVSAIAALGSFAIVWGLNKLNRSYLHHSIETAKRTSSANALEDAELIHSSIHELSRQINEIEGNTTRRNLFDFLASSAVGFLGAMISKVYSLDTNYFAVLLRQ
jgi:hypothetical protein